MRKALLGVPVLGVALLTGGAALADAPRFPQGVDWQVVGLGKTDFAPSARPTLRVERGRLSGSTGCNRYTGSISIEGVRLSIGPMATTKMFCTGPRGDAERLFSGALTTARGWAMEGKSLIIETGHGPLRLRRR